MERTPPGRDKRIRTIVLLMLFGFFLYRIDLFWGLMSRFLSIVTAFIVGGLTALVINLPMRFLERRLRFVSSGPARHIRRAVCLSIATLFVLAVITLLLVVIIPEVLIAVESLINRIPGLLQQLEDWLATYNTNIRALLGVSEANEASVRDLFQRASNFLLGGINYSSTVFISAAQMIVNLVVGLVFAVYLLYSKERIKNQVRSLITAYLPERFVPGTLRFLHMMIATYSGFIGGQCVQSLISGLLIWLFMLIFGFPYPVLIALITFVCAFIPVFGPYIAGAFGALLILTVAPQQALWFLLMYFIIQQLEASLVYPRILSSAIDIPSIWVLVAVTLGGGIMGIAGMLLFIPFAAVLYQLLVADTERRNALRKVGRNG